MKISEKFNLKKSQAELDFVDIDTSRDMPLFLDPFFLGKRRDRWSVDAHLTLTSFFQRLIDLIKSGNHSLAKQMFEHLHEPNSTCLGLSENDPDGNGVGKEDTSKIFENAIRSKAIQTGLIKDLEDNILFVENFGKDKLSDMTTNIIRWNLITYTQRQCLIHNIELTEGVPSDYFWSRAEKDWNIGYTSMLVIDSKKILLVPKGVVSFSKAYTDVKYYNHFVLNFLQNEHLRLNSALVKTRKSGKRYVTKNDIKKDNPQSKKFLRDFTLLHPEVLQKFKDAIKVESLTNDVITDISIRKVCDRLAKELIEVPIGADYASAFHNKIIGILELILYPDFINPVKEDKIHNGRKRIDITFDNAAIKGIFLRLSEKHGIPCPYLFVECKNYKYDIANPELDQLAGRFSTNRGKVGFIVCRKFEDKSLFIQRCRDTYVDQRGLIVPLDDQDLVNLLDNHNENNLQFREKYFSDIVRAITLR